MTDTNPNQSNQNGSITVGDISHSQQVAVGTNIYMNVYPTNVRNQRNHAVLRQAVNRFWLDGVLKSSLYKEVRIRLNLDENADAADNRP